MAAAGAPAASRAWRVWARATRVLLWLVAGLWVLFILTWFVLQAWIVPRIDDWRPELERWATRAMGVPVTVGAIRALDQPGGRLPPLVPSFDITDVRLHDAQGRAALHLPQVQAALSVASLWRGRFEQILIERPVLDVRRRADGRIEIAGIAFSDGAQGDHAAARWFFDQAEFVVRGGTLRWTDERRALPPVRFTDLDLVARNGARSHDLRLDATPEPEWGDRFSVRALMREPLFALRPLQRTQAPPWAHWRGEIHADLPRVDVARLRTRVDLPDGVEVRSGHGRLRAWAGVTEGRWANLTLDAQLAAVDVQLGADLPALALDTLAGQVDADRDARGMAIGTDNLTFRTREGLTWPGGRVRVEHREARPRQGASTSVQADGIELEALAALAGRLPLPADARGWLQRLAPRGRLENTALNWQARGSGPGAQRTLASARGRVTGLALAGDVVPDARKGTLGGFLAFAPALGAASGALVTWPGLLAMEIRPAIVACLVVLCVAPVLLVRLPPTVDHPVPAKGPDRPQRPRSIVVRMWLARLSLQIAEAALFAFLYLWFRAVDPTLGASRTAIIFGAVLAVSAPIALVVGRWADRHDRPLAPLSFTAAISAIGLVSMALAQGTAPAIAAYGLFGVASSVFLALHSAQTLRVLPRPSRRGRDLGIFNLTNTTPSLVMPALALTLVPKFGFSGLFVMLAVLAALAAILVPRRDP